MEDLAPQLLKLAQIIWINIVLSGDNAVVIALACRGLPADRQTGGMLPARRSPSCSGSCSGSSSPSLLATPYLKIVGALLLFWIARQASDRRGRRGAATSRKPTASGARSRPLSSPTR